MTTPRFCKHCGKERKPTARFCSSCGAAFAQGPTIQDQQQSAAIALSHPSKDDAANANLHTSHRAEPANAPAAVTPGPRCSNCEASLSAGARFCRHCGATVVTSPEAAQALPPQTSVAPAKTKPITCGGKLSATTNKSLWLKVAAAVITIFITGLFLWSLINRDRAPSGYTPLAGISFTPQELAVTGETAVVSPDSPKLTLSGVTVDFGEFNLAEAGKLEIARLVDKIDSEAGVTALSYNISLGDVKEFPAMVEVTIPYNPAGLTADTEEYAISVGRYDENSESWKIIPSSVNTDAKIVTFKTDHFSPFSVLKNTVSKGNIVFYYKDNKYTGPNTPVMVDTGALKKALNSLDADSFDKLLRDKTVPTNEFMSSGFDLINTLASGADYTLAFDNHMRMFSNLPSSALFSKVGAKFTLIGGAAVAYKITDQVVRGVDWERIKRDNLFNALELLVTVGVITTGSPFLLTCGAAIWAVGIVDSMVYDPEDLNTYLGPLEMVYDSFNRTNITHTSNTGDFGAYLSLPGKSVKLRSGERVLSRKSDWSAIVNSIYQKNKKHPFHIKKDVNQLVANHSDVFWEVHRPSLLWWIDQSGILPPGKLAKDLPWPTDSAEIQKYKERCQARTHGRLQPLYKAMAEKEVQDLWTTLYSSAFELADSLNETIVFEAQDPELKGRAGFARSKYAKNVLHLKANGNYVFEDFICSERHEDSNRIFSCNVYHYITSGLPAELTIYPPNADIYSVSENQVPFAPDLPVTVIHLPERDLSGIYTGTSRGKTILGGNTFELRYNAIRIEDKETGLLVGPCFENGDYESELQVLCKYNDEIQRYEGTAFLGGGDQWTELIFSVLIKNEGSAPLAEVTYLQHFPRRQSMHYEYNLTWSGPLSGNAVVRQRSDPEKSTAPEPVTQPGKPVGGFGF